MGDAPRPLSDREIAERLEQLPGWERSGDTITRSYGIRSSADVTHGL
ncbi:4a-hydroxytetrahydrobiopterin dehydratase [Streptomyces albus]|nr:4a-hydroxytetrahydrobiopterin dehydratase [Streptomyces albus]